MVRDVLYLATMFGIAAGTALAAPDVPERPRPDWHVQVCADYDVC